jgi:hypothetical protein
LNRKYADGWACIKSTNFHIAWCCTTAGGQGKSSLAPRDADLPFMNMLESLASSAVRAAGKVQADLIIVYTATGALRVGGGPVYFLFWLSSINAA